MTWIKRLIRSVDHYDNQEGFDAPVLMPADQESQQIKGMSVKRILQTQRVGLEAAQGRLVQLNEHMSIYTADMESRIAALQAELRAETIRLKEEQRQTTVVIDTFQDSIRALEADPSINERVHEAEDTLLPPSVEEELEKELHFSPI